MKLNSHNGAFLQGIEEREQATGCETSLTAAPLRKNLASAVPHPTIEAPSDVVEHIHSTLSVSAKPG